MSYESSYAIRDLRKVVSESFCLKVDALEVARGETLGIVGPTGAGKSTLLRLMSGLDPQFLGTIDALGQAVCGNVPIECLRRIATVPQRPMLLSNSVGYNVEYGLRVRGGGAAGGRTNAILNRLGLHWLARQNAHTLSGGQAQLTAIARALVCEPDVLLLDEPTAHLDPANVKLVEELIDEQKARTGMTIVWATHNLFQARRVASRMALLLDGELIEVDDCKTFFEGPADRRVTDFVEGRMVY